MGEEQRRNRSGEGRREKSDKGKSQWEGTRVNRRGRIAKKEIWRGVWLTEKEGDAKRRDAVKCDNGELYCKTSPFFSHLHKPNVREKSCLTTCG